MRVTWIAQTNHEADCTECEALIDDLLREHDTIHSEHLNGSKDGHIVTLLRSGEQNVAWGE